MRIRFVLLSLAVLSIGGLALLERPVESVSVRSADAAVLGMSATELPPAIVADPAVVVAAYEQWKQEFEASAHVIEIGLTRAASHIDRRQGLRGSFTLDLDDSSAVVRVESAGEPLEAWLVANVDGPRRSFMPEPGDECRSLGILHAVGAALELEVDLSGPRWSDMRLDTVAVTRVGVRPETDVLLTGQSNVFERLYGRELDARQEGQETRFGSGLPLALILPQIAIGAFDPASQLQSLVDHGEKLFFLGTFNGNGRTCGTCHPAENSFTIDPPFIAQMAANDPFDPLFLAEFDPNLDSNQNGGLMFEQPKLMHNFGVILENLDGFDDLQNRFVMRAVSHTFAQDMQRLRPVVGQSPPKQRLGWGGDGAPAAGTLRDFATGAVTQHFPITLNRTSGVDFVLPTSGELDALEAFQLALGRQSEFDLQNPGSPAFIAFEDVDAETGKQSFLGFRCGICHENAGGSSFFTTDQGVVVVGDPLNFTLANGNFDTGVEQFLTNNPDGTGLPRPIDGGFGTQPQGMPLPGGPFPPIPNPDGSFGDRSFNTPSVVEFADTVPGFHNHITASTPLDPDPVMAAVAFYRTAEFANSTGGQFEPSPTLMSGTDIQQIARFLRAINAVQNNHNARRFLQRALTLAIANFPAFEPVIVRGLKLADEEIQDAIDQTGPFGFSPDPVPEFQAAQNYIAIALDPLQSFTTRKIAIQKALIMLGLAENDLVQ
jgi:hypothetical protein